ncbi:MAG: TRAP transporter large permease subunit [Burkholderiaceae bacterium]|nr:TRAP transporter large permease subunit [Burkholderiaceae bacterium]
MRKEMLFGLVIMVLIVAGTAIFLPWSNMSNGHYGLMMLALVVVAIMLGFPTAFTLMGMGMIFGFFAYHSQGQTADGALRQTLDLMVQRTYAVMSNDVLISIPLFVFMGYLVERANLIERLFRSLHLALARLPGSLAVATLFTCAVFATATGIVGAVVTLMGLLALPAMLRAGYSAQISAGAITAGGCLGILIPPSVMLIVYGATAGVSVVQLYAGAFFPGLMLAGLYIVYVIVLAKLRPSLMPPLSAADRHVPLPPLIEHLQTAAGKLALPALLAVFKGSRNAHLPMGLLLRNLIVTLLPAMVFVAVLGLTWRGATAPDELPDAAGLQQMGGSHESAGATALDATEPKAEGVSEPPGVQEPSSAPGVQEPPSAPGVQEPPTEGVKEPPGAAADSGAAATAGAGPAVEVPAAARLDTPPWFWGMAGFGALALVSFYLLLTFVRLEVFKMLLGSFFPLAVLILAVLGTIVFGLATPTEAAAVGSMGGLLLAAAYRQLNFTVVKESVFLTAKTSAMVCWLFVGSSIFSAAFALLGGQEIIEKWVMSLGLSKVQFLMLSQAIIFLLGWPLEWTEIIVIFMPIFIPLLDNFGVDPLFFGLLVALNLQTAFLSPPVAMAAFYLKGVAPPHITLNQIFAGMIPFMLIQVVALALLYVFPAIGLWLPQVLYR